NPCENQLIKIKSVFFICLVVIGKVKLIWVSFLSSINWDHVYGGFKRIGGCYRPFSRSVWTDQGDPINVIKEDGIFMIELNRPSKRNCINTPMAEKLIAAIDEFEGDDESKVGIIYGKGGNFCAGFDLNELASDSSINSRQRIGLDKWMISKPMIAAIEGYAVAGGLELALACDFRACEEDSFLGFYNRRFGIPLLDGGTVRLSRIIGLSRALDLILNGKKISAHEALNMGLVNEICAVGSVLGKAISMASCLRKFDQNALLADRKSIYTSTFQSSENMEEALKFEYSNGSPIMSENGAKGAKLFLEEGIGRHGATAIHSQDEIMAQHKPEIF
ncbi:putative enoyl-CoA hydratase/isomerase YngF, partial [Panonychus citri]|uniref:putative enoyl-CoA hydratase/isomerase YngF n=1 Tax=Panonychus citri TaxID=50023 RepID=UPI002306E3D6